MSARQGAGGQRPPGLIRLSAMGCGYPPDLDCLSRVTRAHPLVYELLFEAMGIACMPWPPGADLVDVDIECRQEGGETVQENGLRIVYGYGRRCRVSAVDSEGRRYSVVIVETHTGLRYCYPEGVTEK